LDNNDDKIFYAFEVVTNKLRNSKKTVVDAIYDYIDDCDDFVEKYDPVNVIDEKVFAKMIIQGLYPTKLRSFIDRKLKNDEKKVDKVLERILGELLKLQDKIEESKNVSKLIGNDDLNKKPLVANKNRHRNNEYSSSNKSIDNIKIMTKDDKIDNNNDKSKVNNNDDNVKKNNNGGEVQCSHCGRSGHTFENCWKKLVPKCEYCQKLGHKEERCYKKNGKIERDIDRNNRMNQDEIDEIILERMEDLLNSSDEEELEEKPPPNPPSID